MQGAVQGTTDLSIIAVLSIAFYGYFNRTSSAQYYRLANCCCQLSSNKLHHKVLTFFLLERLRGENESEGKKEDRKKQAYCY